MPRAPKKGKKRSTAAEDLEDDSELMSPMDAESDIMQIDNNNNNNNKEGGGEDEEEDDDNFIMGSADAKGKAPVQVEEAQLENGKTLVEFLEKLDDYQPIVNYFNPIFVMTFSQLTECVDSRCSVGALFHKIWI